MNGLPLEDDELAYALLISDDYLDRAAEFLADAYALTIDQATELLEDYNARH